MPNPGCCSCCGQLAKCIGFHFDTPPTATHPQVQLTFTGLPSGCFTAYEGVPAILTFFNFSQASDGKGCIFDWKVDLPGSIQYRFYLSVANGESGVRNGVTARSYIGSTTGFGGSLSSAALVESGNTNWGYFGDVDPMGPIAFPLAPFCQMTAVTFGQDYHAGCADASTRGSVLLLP